MLIVPYLDPPPPPPGGKLTADTAELGKCVSRANAGRGSSPGGEYQACMGSTKHAEDPHAGDRSPPEDEGLNGSSLATASESLNASPIALATSKARSPAHL